ncbi:SDR family NAD(P)-dependent oxidoreductase [Alkalicaulis satelles]|uniref:SDR family NAD(P)-dependent oxidoreductase n=1 Tax=Alkalicaulis satelles TaxID=2609175 RepID=A0A5M6ZP93_9PROT|nr:SDR family NAD(P)-dependent oxidoreductase [Alkalicaulis satelles]KAA5805394.1 SDR family NAD(P)-dependent oxidoreductase [Alkalicaulis satelles]
MGAPSQPGRVTLVTGAGKGLGRAFALACMARGDAVVVNNRRREGAEDSAEQTAAEIRAAGGRAAAELSDITDPGAGEAMVQAALSAFGRLDAVIFNAGVNGAAGRFMDLPADEFATVMAVNLTAQIALARAALPHLRESPAGRMVFVSSSAGLYGIYGRAPYSASKAALNGFALALAQEERRGPVRVNVLAPYAATRMTGDAISGEMAARFTPEAAAPACAFLASAACERGGEIWVTGGGFARRAAMMEGGGSALPATVAEADLARAGAMDGAREASGAPAAFMDFVKCAQEAQS